jgi:demethylmenaquinone methyltransferase/2-methoxy-6-polyprenyl-1,4-benzoquinol methylase
MTLQLQRRVGSDGHVIGSDFSERMLDLAREKGASRASSELGGTPIYEWEDALELTYDDDAFDAVTVGFGVRNFADLDRGLAEMNRVLKPGGRMVILEITQPQRPPLSTFFSLWFDRLVPLLGNVAGDAEAYSYLPESVKRFPPPEDLAEKMERAGLAGIRWTILAGGIIAIHSGVKPGS